MPKEELPPTDAKPVYNTVVVTMAAIDPAQSLFYEACPANHRKACIRMPGVPFEHPPVRSNIFYGVDFLRAWRRASLLFASGAASRLSVRDARMHGHMR